MSDIPKKIHYVWLGKNDKPQKVLDCIASWKKCMPEYEIIEWNEDNFDIKMCDYLEGAYKAEKWAFASDYIRFKVLYEYGGIYFDTDVEVLKPIPDSVLEYNAFSAVESSGNVSPGLVFGCTAHNKVAQYMIQTFENRKFDKDSVVTVNKIITDYLYERGFKANNKFQIVEGLAIYPSEYFCGYNQDIMEYDIRPETISVHHYDSSWLNSGQLRKKNLKIAFKKFVGINNYKRMQKIKRKLFGISKI